MPDLGVNDLLLFVALLIPGFLSVQIYALLHPTDEVKVKADTLPAIAFGVANAAFTYPLVYFSVENFALTENLSILYLISIGVLFVTPVIWPVTLFYILKKLADWRFILQRERNAWDAFFLRGDSCWVIVHFRDGRRIGGYYGPRSYAGLYPDSGHLYLEKLWKLTDDGEFGCKIERTKGLLLRPDDYHLIELFEVVEEDG